MILYTVITLPADVATSTLAYAGDLFTDLWILIAIAVGVPFGFYVIRRIIALFPKGK